jgi:hypothetical protein
LYATLFTKEEKEERRKREEEREDGREEQVYPVCFFHKRERISGRKRE